MKKLFFLSFAVMVLIGFWLVRLGDPLVHAGAPGGILSFELAWTEAGLARIIGPWDPSLLQRAIRVNLVDYLFMASYGTFFASASLLVARRAGRLGRSGIAKWGAWGLRLSVTAAALDGIENGFGFPILLAGAKTPWVQLMSLAATLKFSVLGAVLVFLLTMLAKTLRKT